MLESVAVGARRSGAMRYAEVRGLVRPEEACAHRSNRIPSAPTRTSPVNTSPRSVSTRTPSVPGFEADDARVETDRYRPGGRR